MRENTSSGKMGFKLLLSKMLRTVYGDFSQKC